MPTLGDAINVTGATTGKVISTYTAPQFNLTAAQKTALGSFVTSLGSSWPGGAGNIWAISLNRSDGAPQTIQCTVIGFLVHADATAAVNAATQQNVNIIGIVP
jgi:hypothetical protein